MARCAECTSSSPHRSQLTRMNQDGNAANGSPMASAPEGNGSVPSLRQLRRGGTLLYLVADPPPGEARCGRVGNRAQVLGRQVMAV